MADTFDPYHKWLGIPEDQRPATHYQLLGISPTEHDPAVIAAAAARMSAYIRNFASSRHGQEAARILEEITAAQVCLLDPARRAAYDANLRRNQPRPVPKLTEPFREAQRARVVKVAPAAPVAPAKKLEPDLEQLFADDRLPRAPARVSGRLGRQSLRKLPSMQMRRQRSVGAWGAAAGAVAALSLAIIAFAILSDRGQAKRAVDEPSKAPGGGDRLAQSRVDQEGKPSEPAFEGPDFTGLMPDGPPQTAADKVAGTDAEKKARERPSAAASDPASAPGPGRGGPNAKTAERVRALNSRDAHSRWQAARALRDMGSQAAGGVAALVAALEDGDGDVAAMAAEALGAIGPVNEDVVPALAKALGHPDWPVRWSAARALANIGPKAQEATAALRKVINSDPDRDVREQAQRALRKVSGKPESLTP